MPAKCMPCAKGEGRRPDRNGAPGALRAVQPARSRIGGLEDGVVGQLRRVDDQGAHVPMTIVCRAQRGRRHGWCPGEGAEMNTSAALAARAGYRLPYCHAEMALATLPGETRYFSVRRRLGRLPAFFETSARVGEPLGSAAPGTLEHFLVERYLLYADWGGGRLRV